ncbi:hypothetical protein [Gramella sp. AN32]|uniref:Helix-turn-helix domain-containing protein n=1 Tax=Christiangramia antarctica TaxID=2058158 RepID=A0ABW5X6Z6_9FLAO|nr:hypothetical protein [Gramella sp. AN32]MCM4154752.1 hypothetical protein [Gramella sp. AN32]
MNGYELSRAWFDFSFTNTCKVNPVHSAIFFFAIERCNRLGWKKEFGFPTDLAMEAVGIKNYKTYYRALQDLVEWGFIRWIQKSKNQYTANIIALVKIDDASPQALNKALSGHYTKQDSQQVQSNYRGIASINKPINHKPLNLELINQKPLLEVEKINVEKDQEVYFKWALKFHRLFLKNLEQKGAPLKKTKEAVFEDCVKPIRDMMEKDGVNAAQLQIAYDLLNGQDDFWKGVILDTGKLKEKIGQLIAQGKMPMKEKDMDIRVKDKVRSYD